MIPDETQYRLLKQLDADPHISQRELSRSLGISLGKVNYCLKALIDQGLVKAENSRSNGNRQNYSYLLTPKGQKSKAAITTAFLQSKQQAMRQLGREIEELRQEIRRTGKVIS